MSFDTLIQSLTNNRVDLIVGTLGITDARKAQFAFSQKVYTDSDALIMPQSDTMNYVTYDDLAGEILGLQKGVVPLTSLHTDKYTKIRIYDGGPDAMRGLVAGDVQPAVANRSIASYMLKTGEFPTLHLVPSFKPDDLWRRRLWPSQGRDRSLRHGERRLLEDPGGRHLGYHS